MEHRVYIHIGMPKTGTTFIQTKHFDKLRSGQVVYNPPSIHAKIQELICERDPEKRQWLLLSAMPVIKSELAKLPDLPILLSDESFTIKDWQFDYKTGLNVFQQLFPNAKILLTLRFQTDWCLSIYKQGVQQGAYYHGFKTFLQFKNSEFQSSTATPTVTNIHTLDYVGFIRDYQAAFGAENILVSFFEDLRNDPDAFIERIFDFIDIKPAVLDTDMHYRGLSALSLYCLIGFGRLNRLFGFNVPHTYPKKGYSWIADRARQPLKKRDRLQAPWAIISILISRFLLTFSNWVAVRNFLQRRIDRYVYVDWDLFPAGSRQRLQQLAREKNAGMEKLPNLPTIPDTYLQELSRVSTRTSKTQYP
jgi:hypothetical protein